MGTFSAAILAGGHGLRMGNKNKAFLRIGERCFLEETILRLRPLFEDVMIVGASSPEYEDFGLPVYPDLRPGSGSLGGILTALARSPAPMTFCTACDMPFLSPSLIAHLLFRASEGWEAVLPSLAKGIEPLCAVYSASLAPRIERLLDGGERRIRLLLGECRTLLVDEAELRVHDPRLLSFFNVNTPEDLEEAYRLREELLL